MLLGYQVPQIAGRGQIYSAKASITSPVIYSTAAGTGGPLLYNPTGSGVTAYLIAMSYGLTTASSVAGSVGIAGGISVAPTSTTAIDISGAMNLSLPSQAAGCSVYNKGTVTGAPKFYMPTGRVHTGAVTVDTDDDNFIHFGAGIIIPPGAWAACSAGATLTSAVIDFGLVWIEVQND